MPKTFDRFFSRDKAATIARQGQWLRLCFFLFACIPIAVQAQDDDLRFADAVYLDNIATVQLHLSGAPLTLPIVDLKAQNNTLLLDFDLLSENQSNFTYTIVHCNADWQPSELADQEYIDGFTEDRLLNYQISFNTRANYFHYTLGLPNANMRWTRSGNYLLKVYEDEDEKRLALTRRFMVVEGNWRIESGMVAPAQVNKRDTHQEFDFNVLHKGTRVPDPQHDIKAFMLQNGRWDNAIGPLKPFVSKEDKLVFDYQDKIVFPAGKEWRIFDMRTFDNYRENVIGIIARGDHYDVTLRRDKDRSVLPYLFVNDIDGRYSVETTNRSQTSPLEYDYATVLFSLERKAEDPQHEFYVFGELTNWELKPEFKMTYNEQVKAYYTEIPNLKQGFYNYCYVMLDRQTGVPDIEGVEGNWYETQNKYTVLIYFRPFGERYDRLMGAATFQSGN